MADKRPKPPTDEAMKARALSEWEGEGGAPSHERKPKHPRDPNQLAKSIIDIATGQKPDRDPTPEEQGKDPAAVALGKKGGKARSDRLSEQRRKEIAAKAAAGR